MNEELRRYYLTQLGITSWQTQGVFENADPQPDDSLENNTSFYYFGKLDSPLYVFYSVAEFKPEQRDKVMLFLREVIKNLDLTLKDICWLSLDKPVSQKALSVTSDELTQVLKTSVRYLWVMKQHYLDFLVSDKTVNKSDDEVLLFSEQNIPIILSDDLIEITHCKKKKKQLFFDISACMQHYLNMNGL